MGQHKSKPSQKKRQDTIDTPATVPHSLNRKFSLVTDSEVRIISTLFKNLAERSTGNTIDKNSFLQFCDLPVTPNQGLLGERLFETFDMHNNGCIDLDEFIKGINQYCRVSNEDKYKLLFSLYDLRGDGYVHKSELVTMVSFKKLHNTFKATIQDYPEAEQLLRAKGQLPQQYKTFTSYALLKRQSTNTQKASEAAFNIQMLTDQIWDTLDKDKSGSLTFDQFKIFLMQYPRILQVFSDAFHESIWSRKDQKRIKAAQSKMKKKSYNWCGLSRCRSSSFLNSSLVTADIDIYGSVYIQYKASRRIIKRWLALNKGVLFIYSSSK